MREVWRQSWFIIYRYRLINVWKKFDTSYYPENHPSEIKTGINKKVIGTFKDEACGKQITLFVGLRESTPNLHESGYSRRQRF